MKNTEIAAAIHDGHRILFHAINSEHRHEAMKAVYRASPVLVRVGNVLRHPAGDGLCHFVLEDREVIGREYTLAATRLTEIMQTRIRPR